MMAVIFYRNKGKSAKVFTKQVICACCKFSVYYEFLRCPACEATRKVKEKILDA